MRGRDADSGDFLDSSRSARRRDALDTLELAETLSGLSDAQLGTLPIPEDLLPHVREVRRITAHIAHKRQIAFLAKQMRKEEDATLSAIRAAMDANSEGSRRQVAEMHRAEAWRDRLLAGGDEDLAAFIAEHPAAERQRLRQLLRNAREDAARGRPPKSYRALYREIRSAAAGNAHAADSGVADERTGVPGGESDEARSVNYNGT